MRHLEINGVDVGLGGKAQDTTINDEGENDVSMIYADVPASIKLGRAREVAQWLLGYELMSSKSYQ